MKLITTPFCFFGWEKITCSAFCAVKSLRKIPCCRHREVFLARVTSNTAPQCWHKAGGDPGHPQDTHSPQTALQQLQQTDHHPHPPFQAPWAGKASSRGCLSRGGSRAGGRSHLGHSSKGALALPGHRGGNNWRLDCIFGCSSVLTLEKQATELLSWDGWPSSWFSPTFPGWKQLTRLKMLWFQLVCWAKSDTGWKHLYLILLSSERTLACASKEHNGKTQTGWRKKGVFVIINCERLSKMSCLSKIYLLIWPFQLTINTG